ncbi:MAG: AMIN domain-containing protein, partial [Proteobacteria bacterium]|nr:AMIN domain-containing protein [Pseudomonadota bacterium]
MLCLPANAAVPVVTDARIGTHPGQTRLVLDVSRPVQYKIFTLSNPYRVVVDFPALRWRVNKINHPQSLGVISSYRYGLFQAGVSRLVIDVTNPVQIARHQILRPVNGGAYRFLIDLKPVSETDFKAGKKLIVTKKWKQPQPQNSVAFRPSSPPRRGPPRVVKRIIMLDPGHGGPDPGAIGIR